MPKNKIALITGASRGIGKGVAGYLATLGYHVILVARTEEALKVLCGDINAQQVSASYYALDLVKKAKNINI